MRRGKKVEMVFLRNEILSYLASSPHFPLAYGLCSLTPLSIEAKKWKQFHKKIENTLSINHLLIKETLFEAVQENIHAFFIHNTFISNARLKLAKNQANAKQHPEVQLLLLDIYADSSYTLSSRNNGRYSKN